MSRSGLTISFAKKEDTAAADAAASAAGLAPLVDPEGIDLVGVKSERRMREKVHMCINCNFPIMVYGRLVPCQHAYCWTCANEACKEKTCLLCAARIEELEELESSQGVCICAHCLKCFQHEDELRAHVVENHRPRPAPQAPPSLYPPQMGIPPPLPPGPRPGMPPGQHPQPAHVPPPAPPPGRPPADQPKFPFVTQPNNGNGGQPHPPLGMPPGWQ